MEMGLRLVVIAMVALIASTVVIFLFTGQVDGFSGILNSQTDQSQCKLLIERGKLQKALNKGCTQEEVASHCSSLSDSQCQQAEACTLGIPQECAQNSENPQEECPQVCLSGSP